MADNKNNVGPVKVLEDLNRSVKNLNDTFKNLTSGLGTSEREKKSADLGVSLLKTGTILLAVTKLLSNVGEVMSNVEANNKMAQFSIWDMIGGIIQQALGLDNPENVEKLANSIDNLLQFLMHPVDYTLNKGVSSLYDAIASSPYSILHYITPQHGLQQFNEDQNINPIPRGKMGKSNWYDGSVADGPASANP